MISAHVFTDWGQLGDCQAQLGLMNANFPKTSSASSVAPKRSDGRRQHLVPLAGHAICPAQRKIALKKQGETACRIRRSTLTRRQSKDWSKRIIAGMQKLPLRFLHQPERTTA